MRDNTITLDNNPYEIGDTISIMQLDNNRWRRFWCFITFRPRPMYRQEFMVTGGDANTVKVEPRWFTSSMSMNREEFEQMYPTCEETG